MIKMALFLGGISISIAHEEVIQSLHGASIEKIESSRTAVEELIHPIQPQVEKKKCGSCRSSFSFDSLPSKSSHRKTELLIFVSFSMPAESLKSLYEAAQKIGGRLVLKGLYQNSFRQTLRKTQSLGIVLDIDPPLFLEYGIISVPTVILQKQNQFDQVSGNISLLDALKIIASAGELKEEAADYMRRGKATL